MFSRAWLYVNRFGQLRSARLCCSFPRVRRNPALEKRLSISTGASFTAAGLAAAGTALLSVFTGGIYREKKNANIIKTRFIKISPCFIFLCREGSSGRGILGRCD